MLAAVANSAESSQLLQHPTTDPRQSCTLRIKGGRKQLIHFPIICTPHRTTFSGPPATSGSVFGDCKDLLCTWICSCTVHYHPRWMRGSRMGGTQLPRISGDTHWKLPAAKPGPLHVFLPHWFKMEGKVCHRLGLLCYGRSEMSPNSLMKQNDSDPLPLQCTHSFHPKIRLECRADLFRSSRGPPHPRMLCLQ